MRSSNESPCLHRFAVAGVFLIMSCVHGREVLSPRISELVGYWTTGEGLPVGSPVLISSLTTDKVLYSPTEAGTASVRVENVTATAQKFELAVALRTGLRDEREIFRQAIELPAGAALPVSVPLHFRDEDFGCEVRAMVIQAGKSLVAKREYFSVTDHFAKVGIGSTWGSALHTANPKHVLVPERTRKLYSNYFELFFWSPCDWALHVAPQKQWWSGQASYPEDEDNLADLINKSHEQGIKVAFYASCNPAGPFGWEAARRHPQWFGGGNLNRNNVYNVEALDNWNNPHWRTSPDRKVKGKKQNPGWYRLAVDLRREDALDYGIDRLIDTVRKYHWDAVRFDGHYTTLGNDEMSTRNMRRLKERMWDAFPGFCLGFNYGRAPEWLGGVNHEMREGMAGGGIYLQEGIRNWRYTNDQYVSWNEYATNELRVAKEITAMGGNYHCMWSDLKLTPAQTYYKLIYGLIAGGHPADADIYANTEGCAQWGAFMTRWSSLLWHQNLKSAPGQVEHIKVDGGGLLWKPFVQERIVSATKKQVIVHMIDPSPVDAIANTTFAAKRGSDVHCFISYAPPGQTVLSATLVRPDALPFDASLSPDGNRYQLPWPGYWQIVVFEVEGKYVAPVPTAVFTERPDPGKLKWSPDQKLVTRADPNKAEDIQEPADSNETIVSLATGGVNIGRVTTIDADSPQRSVQWRNKEKSVGNMGKFWTGPYAPGKYRFFIRMKWTDVGAQPTPQSLAIRVLAEKGQVLMPTATLVTPANPNAPQGAIVLGERGKYQTYEFGSVDIKQAELFSFDGKATTTAIGDNTLYAEKIIVQLVERYTDAQLATLTPVVKPDALREPRGTKPGKILVVKGLFTGHFQIEQAIGKSAEVIMAYDLPAKYEDLYAYDAVVLSNVDFSTSAFAMRSMLRDYVNDGGRLVMLGGNATLGEGGMQGTYLDELSPFTLKGVGEVVPCAPPLPLLGPDASARDNAFIFWRHDVRLRPAATVIRLAGSIPVAARMKTGKGVANVFAGTVLGEGADQARPFWESQLWLDLARQLILE